MGVSLFPGYLFRRCQSRVEFLMHRCRIQLSMIDSNTILTLGILNGETPHSFRSGCAITMGFANPRMSKEGIKIMSDGSQIVARDTILGRPSCIIPV